MQYPRRSTHFKMKQKSGINIRGSKLDSVNYQLLVSTGIPALDDLLGGGLPVGGLLLIDEDLHGSYANILMKYFLAEGVVNDHSCFVASLDIDPEKTLVNNLPILSKDENASNAELTSGEKMKIAFRYQNLPLEKQNKMIGNYFDLSEKMPSDVISKSDINYFTEVTNNFYDPSKESAYNKLLETTAKIVKTDKFLMDENFDKKNILRMCIHHLGSPMWSLRNNVKEVGLFLYKLKCLVRKSFSVAMVTVPSHLSEQLKTIFSTRLIHLSDIALKLETFVGTQYERNPSLSDFHGFFHITKMASINSLTSKHPGAVEYVFKLRRKKFCIERLHLPPCFESSDDKPKKATLGCASSSSGGNVLDF